MDGTPPPFRLINIDLLFPFSLTPVHLSPAINTYAHTQIMTCIKAKHVGLWCSSFLSLLLVLHILYVSVSVFYRTVASSSSGTSTLRLQATRSPSVAIWLRGALLCICRTPSICPLRRRPTLGGECTSVGEPTEPELSKRKMMCQFVNSIKERHLFWQHFPTG